MIDFLANLMNQKIGLGVIASITLGIIFAGYPIVQQAAGAEGIARKCPCPKAPPAITGDNVYVAWWTNKSGNNEVMFRASTDAGKTFGDKINLSNTTNAESTDVEIDLDANSVVVTWWEANQTSDVPVMRISNDNGKTFGPMLILSGNGPIGSGEANPAM